LHESAEPGVVEAGFDDMELAFDPISMLFLIH
jgi:hypothetical protein